MVVEDPLDHQRRQAERRLVEQQQPRPAHQRPADRQHLLLAARTACRRPGRGAPSAAGTARRPSRGPRRSPRRSDARDRASRRFSRTVSPPKMRRPSGQCEMPSATIRSVGARVMSAPSNVIAPWRGRSSPEIVRSVVLLPAPFEPISATSSPLVHAQRHALERADVAVADVDFGELKHVREPARGTRRSPRGRSGPPPGRRRR